MTAITYTAARENLAATMNQVAPVEVKRKPLFFELEGGDAWSTSATETYEQKAKALHWQH